MIGSFLPVLGLFDPINSLTLNYSFRGSVQIPGEILKYNVHHNTVTGRVLEVCMTAPLANYPNIRVDFSTVGGISGAPVFNKEGIVIGIVTRGWEGIPETTIGLMNGILNLQFEETNTDGSRTKATIKDFVSTGHIKLET